VSRQFTPPVEDHPGQSSSSSNISFAMAIRKRNQPRVFKRQDNYNNNTRLKTLTSDQTTNESSSRDERDAQNRFAHEIDVKMGFERYEGGQKQRVGWLINMHTTMLVDEDGGGRKSAVDFYFIDDDGGGFKATVQYNPYFLVACKVVSLVGGELMGRVGWRRRLRSI
jgi:hypothetical protein